MRFSGPAEDGMASMSGSPTVLLRLPVSLLPGCSRSSVTADDPAPTKTSRAWRRAPTRNHSTSGQQASFHPARPHISRCPTTPYPRTDGARDPPDRLPRHHPALAPQLLTPPSRQSLAPENTGSTAYRPQYPRPHRASGARKPELALSENPRRHAASAPRSLGSRQRTRKEPATG